MGVVVAVGEKREDGESEMGSGVRETVRRNGFEEKEGSGSCVWRARTGEWREREESRSEGICSSHYFGQLPQIGSLNPIPTSFYHNIIIKIFEFFLGYKICYISYEVSATVDLLVDGTHISHIFLMGL